MNEKPVARLRSEAAVTSFDEKDVDVPTRVVLPDTRATGLACATPVAQSRISPTKKYLFIALSFQFLPNGDATDVHEAMA